MHPRMRSWSTWFGPRSSCGTTSTAATPRCVWRDGILATTLLGSAPSIANDLAHGLCKLIGSDTLVSRKRYCIGVAQMSSCSARTPLFMLPLAFHLLTIPLTPNPSPPSLRVGERGERVYCSAVAASSEDSRYFTNRSISAGFQQPHLNRFLPSRSTSTGGYRCGARLGQFVYGSIFGRKYHPRQQAQLPPSARQNHLTLSPLSPKLVWGRGVGGEGADLLDSPINRGFDQTSHAESVL